jgi:hypothetical protein
MTRSLRRAPIVLALLLPVVTFIIIGRTVEIERDRVPQYTPGNDEQVAAVSSILRRTLGRKLGLSGTSSAGAGISMSFRCTARRQKTDDQPL